MEHVDLCILGAGAAGVAGAIRAHDLGKRVVLVDGGPLGGAALFDGALSSKTLWHLAGDYARARRTDRGYDGCAVTLNWADVRATTAAACAEAQALLAQQLAALGPGLRRVCGRGRFVDAHTVEVRADDGATSRVRADRVLIAVGSRPRVPPGLTVDGECVVTSDHIERQATLPRRLAIVGAGVVGCEYATIFAMLGQTEVELFDRQARILPFEDEDVSAVVATRFGQLGIRVHRQSKLTGATRIGAEVELTWTDEAGQAQRARYDRVLVATGRAPALAPLDLAAAGLATDDAGALVTDAGRCRPDHIWAAGDATPDLMLANLAEIEARHAVEEMFGYDPAPIVYEAQSAIYFLSPEVATVGLGEQMAQAKGIPYRAAVVSNRLSRRNLAMRATDGFVKLLARRDGRLLGLRVVGPQAGACIQGVALLIGQGGTLEDLDRSVHPHPAVTEGVQEAARLLLGRSLYKPAAMDGLCRVIEGRTRQVPKI
ncbi:MAG: NAD(P)/FAD-dependent oxidoreductase [Kofleriaceae bacterium]|nr:NAD(P)/FAD-dependent oxidoreductase [Kofleriaceae bacterium]MBP6837255.1 NAD(P)/FAD-dependent oxidoreductase [Kofleriaceae bacterium]MBP9206189.1 NAD(P)/FAD-dependent oxidoreductase [Kofleriaceae bacterium]